MLLMLGILTLLIVAGACWFVGFWNNLITLVITVIAALTATSFFENLAAAFEGSGSTYTYLLDFMAIWLLFVGVFSVLRVATDFLSQYRVKFNIVLEMIGRSVTSLLIGFVFITFSSFTMHFAPIPDRDFNDRFTYEIDPFTKYLGVLDYGWCNFVRFESNNALSEFANPPWLEEVYRYINEDGDEVAFPGPAEDEDAEAERGERIWYRRPFDPAARIPGRYADRRRIFDRAITAQERELDMISLRVGREDPE